MTLQLVLAGLYPPKGTALEWNKELNWMPIPYDYEPLNQDTLLLVRTSCPRYHEELERILNEGDVKKVLEENAALFENLTRITGLETKTPDDVQCLYSTLKAEQEFGLKLPDWTLDYFPKKIQSLTDKSYIYNAFNAELKRLKGGVFVKKAISDWDNIIANKLKSKIQLFAGHDSTVTNILSAFNVWTEQFPNYGITGLLEFYRNKKSDEYGVQILLRNSSKEQPHKRTIPGCEEFCELNKLKKLLDENIPKDFEKECLAKNEDFTEPTVGGP
jgi:prostatic aicd phosphatase